MAAFGTLVAAGLPLLLGLTAVVATIGLFGPLSHVIPVANAITSVVLLVGLAVGVDYSMFYIRSASATSARPGATTMPRLDIAAATSGRAVLISGLTVMVAMSGMFVVGHPVFQSFAIGHDRKRLEDRVADDEHARHRDHHRQSGNQGPHPEVAAARSRRGISVAPGRALVALARRM